MERADRDEVFHFAGFCLDRRGGGLFQRGENGVFTPVPIGHRALDVLAVLVERAGDIVTREEMLTAAWPGSVVEDNNLNMQIAALRRVLDAGRNGPSHIQTIPRRGYRFIPPVTRARRPAEPAPQSEVLEPTRPDQLPSDGSQSHRRAVAAGVLGALLLVAIVCGAIWTDTLRRPAGGFTVPRLSIVVLPFANLIGDPGQQYFVDAITEDLTTELSRLADILVISRNTAFTYKDKPITAERVGRELGVRYVLEGSVQRFEARVRINTQLIDAETDTHLWADRFEGGVGDLLSLQNDIISRIAIALDRRLITSEAARPKEHPDALDYIFRGRAEIYKPPSRQSFANAVAEFERALTVDARSIEAQTRLAIALSTRVLDKMSDAPAADLDRANRLIEQAMAAAPASALLHFAKGQLLRAEHDCEAAIPEYEIVVAANRNSLAAIGNIGRCKMLLGQLDEGVVLEEKAMQLSPRDPFIGVWVFRIGQARLLQMRIDEAIHWLKKARSENPAFAFVSAWLAAAYGLKGDLSLAAAELAEARRLSGNGWPASIATERTGAAKDFQTPATQALLENTFLSGLRRAGLPEQ